MFSSVAYIDQLTDCDRLGFVAFRSRQMERQDPVSAFRFDLVSVDFDRHRESPIKASC